MKKREYSKGLHDLGNGIYAYLQPNGAWGLSNAGLIVEGDQSLLVDTLFDLALTREMLDNMSAATKAAASIDTLVITHGNGDHFYGSELVKGAEIITTRACAQEMAAMPPQMLAELAKAAPGMGDLGAFVLQCFGRFKFDDISPVTPTRTFDKRMDLQVGSREVQLIEVGPAHTRGDLIVYLPGDRVVFTGDILFIGGTPLMWAGPAANWIKACDLLLEMDVETIVPGHGPIVDKKGVEPIKAYWKYLLAETRKRYDAGMSEEEAVTDIPLDDYASWTDKERIVINVNTLYKEFSGDNTPPNVVELFGGMARIGLRKAGT